MKANYPLIVLCTVFLVNCLDVSQPEVDIGSSNFAAIPNSPDQTQHLQRLARLIEDVFVADGFAYGLRDSAGNSMDTAKVIADPSGGYLAVSHHYDGVAFEVTLARSSDLLNWDFVQRYGKNTSQPYLAIDSSGGFVLADELATKTEANLHLRYYPNKDSLFANKPTREIVLPHTRVPVGRYAEGTPSIDEIQLSPNIDNSTIRIGFHYWKDGDVDRVASGFLTNFKDWKSQSESEINDLIFEQGVRGNIGDRDTLFFDDALVMIQEGQGTKDDFSSWREFLISKNGIKELSIKTHLGSRAFCNPTLTIVPGPLGGRVLVITQFVPFEGAAPGESGQLIYYRSLSN